MLVLARHEGEDIIILPPNGPPITVRVHELRGGIVRIGIDAPREIPVYRREIFEEMHPEMILPRLAKDFAAEIQKTNVPAHVARRDDQAGRSGTERRAP